MEEKQNAALGTAPLGKLMVKFALPCTISLLVGALYNIVDQIFIGWGVGYLGNGATNVVFPLTVLALGLEWLLYDALVTKVAQIDSLQSSLHLSSIGTAGVPGVGLITLSMVFASVNLPVEGIGLIMGIDRILDMTRTAVNVTGDAICTTIVAKQEGEFNETTFYSDESQLDTAL